MIETKDYWIVNNKLIFKYNFNSLINVCIDLISKYDELIFSNYNDMIMCLETNNDHSSKYYENYKKSKFNKKIKLPENLLNVNFGYSFNQKVDLPSNLLNLTFGDDFNQKVDLPQNLQSLTFGWNFNQKVTLPKKLLKLTFSYNFNQLIELPDNLLSLTLIILIN